MADSQTEPRRRMGWRGWTLIGVIAVLLVGGIVWGVLANSGSDQADPGASTSPGATPTPQPTEFETPSPGATDGVAKPDDGEEVPIDEPAPAVEGVVTEVTDIEAITAGNDIPGEPSGPAIQVTVRLTNGSEKAIDTAGANVTLTYGGDDRLPAAGLTGEGTSVWPSSVAAGASADAVFQFAVPSSPDGDVRVIVDILAAVPNVVFVGPRP
ncbi:hypothetical protein [Microbacterium phyllosphaerae]|uniref:hypothetical protein n=1 Tax=Microbacterium phyllosphaerae TaxID=124798 RepID=UPI0021682374|nr:hypothetical protein [Microbacterium phyllosphaerae]MCS3442536.1 hypothetical protein [Microbacterium phyllosphaerae]